MMPALEVRGLAAWYGPSRVVSGVDFTVAEGETLALMGRNGAGKTTTLRAIMGLHVQREGTIRLFGRSLAPLGADAVARSGMTLVLEDRGVFRSLTVAECLRLARSRAGPWTPARVLAAFPRLYERRSTRCGHLSGGEQQMLAIARALLLHPRVLMLDEPTQGLAPVIVSELLTLLQTLRRDGLTLLIVEQNFAFATAIADRALVLEKGVVAWNGTTADLRADATLTRALLGV